MQYEKQRSIIEVYKEKSILKKPAQQEGEYSNTKADEMIQAYIYMNKQKNFPSVRFQIFFIGRIKAQDNYSFISS